MFHAAESFRFVAPMVGICGANHDISDKIPFTSPEAGPLLAHTLPCVTVGNRGSFVVSTELYDEPRRDNGIALSMEVPGART